MPDSARPAWLAAAPFIFLALWSGGYVAAKIGLRDIEPLTLLVVRYALVVALMAVVFAILRPPLPRTWRGWVHLSVVGLLIQTVYFGFSYLSFGQGLAAALVALMMSLQPILVAILAPGVAGERVGWRRWAGLLLGLAGTVTVILARSEIATPPALGLFFAALALFGMIAATLYEKRFGLSYHPVTSNLIGFAAGLIGILPFALALETQTIHWTADLGLVLGYLVLGNSLTGTTVLLAMIRYGEVSRVSALMFLVPPVAAVLAWVLLDEIMPPLAWAGMALAGVGVIMATRR
jgi:drug/metabolite transporter (DMT)-like permease